jgi:hypothetical protein
MPKKSPPEGALFVRLPAAAVEKLDRAADALGMRKKDLVAGLVSKYVDPDSDRGRTALGALSTHKLTMGFSEPARGWPIPSWPLIQVWFGFRLASRMPTI